MSECEFESDEKTILFVDGYNLHSTVRVMNIEVDFSKFLKYFKDQAPLVRAYYFTTVPEEGSSAVQPLLDWLDYNGYTTVTRANREFVDTAGRKRYKGSITVDLVVKAMQMANHCDHIVLVSGDGEYNALVRALQDIGKKVTVVSTITTQPPMIADELRRAADGFIDIATIASKISRPASNNGREGNLIG